MTLLHGIQHGGPDAQGAAPHDFSTNGNACGPCPDALRALQRADAEHYPDPGYTALRQRLAELHRVDIDRIVIAASASEFIFRITSAVAVHGGADAQVLLPTFSYGDYVRAAQAWRVPVRRVGSASEAAACAPRNTTSLVWHCEPSSPLGQSDTSLGAGLAALPDTAVCVVDMAYAPLRLNGEMEADDAALDRTWQLWTPNKALGLTGIRAAYAVAPIAPIGTEGLRDAVATLAPSWPVGSHGVALLDAWTREPARAWLADSLLVLRGWKARQVALCESMGWRCLPGDANFFCAAPPVDDVAALCSGMRRQGVKLRDTASFGLPGQVRLAALGPASQAALEAAWMR
ncbi:MAG: aminotransferase class I/II-fold pyridoxal phosphate-dependent enzyme [Pseudomonadota bacterium]